MVGETFKGLDYGKFDRKTANSGGQSCRFFRVTKPFERMGSHFRNGAWKQGLKPVVPWWHDFDPERALEFQGWRPPRGEIWKRPIRR